MVVYPGLTKRRINQLIRFLTLSGKQKKKKKKKKKEKKKQQQKDNALYIQYLVL